MLYSSVRGEMFKVLAAHLFYSSVRSGIWQMSLLTELGKLAASQSINITPRRGWDFQTCSYFADEGDSMRKKRLFAFSLMIGLSASFITLQIKPAITAPFQDAKVKQESFTSRCSVIDPLDECIQQRFSKADTIFGFARVATATVTKDGKLIPTGAGPIKRGHKHFFQAETEMERAVIADLERSGLQVGFYLCEGSPHYTTTNPEGILAFDGVRGPVVVTSIAANLQLPESSKVWREAKNALRSFKERDKYEFAVENWEVTARPIRARESCLECHYHQASILSSDAPESFRRLKAGDVLGIAMYAYATKQ